MTQTTSAPTPAKKAVARKVVARKAVAKKAPARKSPAAKKPAPAVAVKTEPKATKPAKVIKPKVDKPKKTPKDKVIRDSFTMPESDFAIIDRIKLRAIEWKQPVKKSEVLRAALHALGALQDAQLKKLLAGLAPVKKGRPNKAG